MLVEDLENTYFRKKRTICYRGKLIRLDKPLVMGILNLTPDSFFDGGQHNSSCSALSHVRQMLEEGADIIDVGGYSTRPNADPVSEQEEIDRITPILQDIFKEFPDIIVSVDTFRASVAKWVNEHCGPCIINDIGGGTLDADMFDTVASLGVPYILMHMKGTPLDMNSHAKYEDVTAEVISDLSEKVSALVQKRVNDIIIDPGFGFAKDLDQNYQLFNHLDDFRIFELPILVGISRKSMIYKLLGSSPNESLNGTTVLNTLALCGGADILRVHDIKAAVEAVSICEKLKSVIK